MPLNRLAAIPPSKALAIKVSAHACGAWKEAKPSATVPHPKGFGSLFHVVCASIVLQTADVILWYRKEMCFTSLVKQHPEQSFDKKAAAPPPQGSGLLRVRL